MSYWGKCSDGSCDDFYKDRYFDGKCSDSLCEGYSEIKNNNKDKIIETINQTFKNFLKKDDTPLEGAIIKGNQADIMASFIDNYNNITRNFIEQAIPQACIGHEISSAQTISSPWHLAIDTIASFVSQWDFNQQESDSMNNHLKNEEQSATQLYFSL